MTDPGRYLTFLLPTAVSSVFSFIAIAWIAVKARASAARGVAIGVLAGQSLVSFAAAGAIVMALDSGASRAVMIGVINAISFVLHGLLVIVGAWAFVTASWGPEERRPSA